jgi:hypothetical protein
MRLDFSARPDAQPLEQLVDGFLFLSGGIFCFIDGLAMTADDHGFGGNIRLEVVARELLDGAVAPLASQYDESDLERAAEILRGAIESIGRQFYASQYESGETLH